MNKLATLPKFLDAPRVFFRLFERMIHWLSQKGPEAKKHSSFYHPIATWLIHYTIVTAVTFLAHDWLMEYYRQNFPREQVLKCDQSTSLLRESTAIFLGAYAVWTLGWRLWIRRKQAQFLQCCVFYESTALCSVTLTLSAFAFYLNRPIIATSFCTVVGFDQILWYVDLAIYFACGKFPIGVTKYIFWPGTSRASRLATTHHLWTLPVVLNAAQGIHPLSLPLSMVVLVANVLLSRWMTPLEIVHGKQSKYINANMAHEFWKDIKLSCPFTDEKLHGAVYVFTLLWKQQVLNCLVFLVLYVPSIYIFGEAPIC